MWMGAILGSCFLGVSVLASHLKPYRGENDGNGLGLMAEYLYGGKGVMFWLTMIATFMILILAANTAYADFPRLSSIIARDGFLPRQFFNKGARLVFSNGVLFLALVAGALIVAFEGDISKLIPLYAFGVFTGFTLSQTGMVRHHLRHREPRWRVGMVINGIGAVDHRSHRDDRGGVEVHRGRLDPRRAHPGDGDRVPGDRPSLRQEPSGRRRRAGLLADAARRTRWWCSSVA